MNRLRLLALVAIALAVLVLVGSLVSGLGPGGEAGIIRTAGGSADGVIGERVRVEVLNAAGISGLARAATEQLRSAGYDVVYYGNAASFGRDTSVVLDRLGRPDAAYGVARAVDIPTVLERRDTTLYLDVTVIIGADWAGIPVPADTLPLQETG